VKVNRAWSEECKRDLAALAAALVRLIDIVLAVS
jgi:hypothetical protein